MLLDLFESIGSIILLPTDVVVLMCTFVLVLWRASKAVRQYLKRPRNIIISGYSLIVGQWLSAFDYIYQGVDRIARVYKETDKRPFAIPAISNYQILVSSSEHFKELAQAPDEMLSFYKAMNERLFFKYTMGGFVPDNGVDTNNGIPNRVFKILVRENLLLMSGPLQEGVADVFARFFEEGRTGEGLSKVSLHTLSGTLIARMNNTLLFGSELARDPGFEKASIKYGWHSGIAMEIFRQIPKCLVPIVAKVFMAWSGAMHKVSSAVQTLVNQRMREKMFTTKEKNVEKHLDCIEWVMSCSHTPEQAHPVRIQQQMMALLFASTHQMQMALTWAIVDLCLHPEYTTLLRTEVAKAFASNCENPYEQLSLMECFLRESSRLNPIDALNVQRKAMQSCNFSGGFHVPAGNLVAIPQREIMRDPAHYTNPEAFNPYRFMSSSDDGASKKYTDVNWEYTFWGSPRLSCPGRWYASYALRHALVHLLTTYEFTLRNPRLGVKRHFVWTTAIVPKSSICIDIRKRNVE
ncbi:cytochrome P450 [Phaeosphaeriaceae sp. PMI808]|nr:cytochrome P450 [Phaeosphaeriaceae sp. PMI808]